MPCSELGCGMKGISVQVCWFWCRVRHLLTWASSWINTNRGNQSRAQSCQTRYLEARGLRAVGTHAGTLQCHGSPGLAATCMGPGKWEQTSSASSEVVVRSLERFPKPRSCKRGCGIFLLVCLLLEVGTTSSPSAGHAVFICCCSRVVAGFEMLASIKGK